MMQTKLDKTVEKVKASTRESKIVDEIIKDVSKYFNEESNFWTNHQVLVMRDIFRGVVVKSWVALLLERLNFIACDNIITLEVVKFYSEYWRERCKALHTPEYEKSSLNNKIKQIKIDAAKGDKVNFEICVDLHPINENETSIHTMRSWVKKARQFRANAKGVKQQDIRKFGKRR